MEFPFELLLNIYEVLDLRGLTNVAISHPHNLKVTEIIFSKKYASKTFEINGKHFYKPDHTYDFETVLSALQVYGHLITKLTVDYDFFNEAQSKRVNEHLSEYGGDSLVEIELKGCNDRFLKGLTGPFKKAEIVSLRDGNVKSNNINFAEVFPAVRVFDLEYMSSISPESINHYFRSLEELKVEYMMPSDSPILERRLQLNPQVRAVSLHGGKISGLKMLSVTLPRLERLVFEEFNGRLLFFGDEINLMHLKAFGIKVTRQFRVSLRRLPIVFGSLEEAMFDVPESSVWFDAIMENKNLKKIVASQLNDEQLQQIADEQPNLEEFWTGYHVETPDAVDNVVRFIESCNNLKWATFFNANDETRAAILNRLYNWEIVERGKSFVFTRK